MAQQTIGIGTVANDGTGDPIRDAFDKCNDNFTELYTGLVGLLDFKGATDCSANPNYPAASKGDFYVVSVAGKIGGASGIAVEIGDAYFATADNAGGTQAGVGSSWSVLQANIVGGTITELDDIPDVNAPTPSTNDALVWNGAAWINVPLPGGGAGGTVPDGGTTGQVLTKTSGVDQDVDWQLAPGALIAVRYFTSGTGATYTPTPGTNSIIIELVGGGGGGGGRATQPAGWNAVGSGGGGGGYVRKRLTANFSGASYSVGVGGSGGAAGNNPGAAGGNTTFTDTAGSPTTYTASGGFGGGGTGGPPTQASSSTPAGTGTNGDVNITGGLGGHGVGYPGPFFAYGGDGGSSRYSSGSPGGYVAANPGAAAGSNAAGNGGGGGGAVVVAAGGNTAGGNGSGGLIVIWEYA